MAASNEGEIEQIIKALNSANYITYEDLSKYVAEKGYDITEMETRGLLLDILNRSLREMPDVDEKKYLSVLSDVYRKTFVPGEIINIKDVPAISAITADGKQATLYGLPLVPAMIRAYADVKDYVEFNYLVNHIMLEWLSRAEDNLNLPRSYVDLLISYIDGVTPIPVEPKVDLLGSIYKLNRFIDGRNTWNKGNPAVKVLENFRDGLKRFIREDDPNAGELGYHQVFDYQQEKVVEDMVEEAMDKLEAWQDQIFEKTQGIK